MSRVADKIIKRSGKRHNVEEYLRKQLRVGKSTSQIAEELECSIPSIRYWLAKYGLSSGRQSFRDRIKDMGYESLRAFFTDKKNAFKSFKQLGKDTGFCYPTVSQHYYEFLEEMKNEQAKG